MEKKIGPDYNLSRYVWSRYNWSRYICEPNVSGRFVSASIVSELDVFMVKRLRRAESVTLSTQQFLRVCSIIRVLDNLFFFQRVRSDVHWVKAAEPTEFSGDENKYLSDQKLLLLQLVFKFLMLARELWLVAIKKAHPKPPH